VVCRGGCSFESDPAASLHRLAMLRCPENERCCAPCSRVVGKAERCVSYHFLMCPRALCCLFATFFCFGRAVGNDGVSDVGAQLPRFRVVKPEPPAASLFVSEPRVVSPLTREDSHLVVGAATTW
jgi:hypothetical protein